MTRYAEFGQSLDQLSTPPAAGTKPDLSSFTMDRHSTIIKYKNSFLSFVLPIRCGFYLAGISDPAIHSAGQNVALKIGQFCSIRDECLDCFGDAKLDDDGKLGILSIERGKCSWPIVIALQRASAQQRQILEENYAKSDPEAVHRVLAIYRELDLKQVYRDHAAQLQQEITQQIEQLSLDHKIPAKIFANYLA